MSILPVIFDPVSDAVELDAMGSTSVWWSLDQNFIYNLSTGRYMRGGAGSSLALSLSETRASPAWVLQGNGVYDEITSGELAIGRGVGLQVSEEVTNKCTNYNFADSLTGIGFAGPSLPTIELVADPLSGTGSAFKITGTNAPGSGLYGYIIIEGIADSGVEHTMSVFARGGSGDLRDNAGDVQVPFGPSAEYSRVKSTWTPAADRKLTLGIYEDEVIYAYGNQLVEGSDVGALVRVAGTAATRAADNPVVIQGYGEELVTNGDFGTGDLTGFTFVVAGSAGAPEPSVSGGTVLIPRTASGQTWILRQQIADDLIVGATYTYSYTTGVANFRTRIGSTQDGSDYGTEANESPGVGEFTFVATGTDAWLYFLPIHNDTVPTVTDITLKQVFPYPGYDLATGVRFRQVFDPSDTAGVEAFTFSDGTADNYLTVRRGSGDGVEVECYSGGVEVFSDESTTDFPTSLATLELYMEQDATVTVSLDGTVLSDITQTSDTLPDFTQLSLACVNGTTIVKEVYGK